LCPRPRRRVPGRPAVAGEAAPHGRRGSDRLALLDQGHRPLVGGGVPAVCAEAPRRDAGAGPGAAGGGAADEGSAHTPRPEETAEACRGLAALPFLWRAHALALLPQRPAAVMHIFV